MGWHSASLWKPFICCPSRNTLSPSCVRARRHRDGLAPGDGQAVGPLQLPQLLQLMYPAGPAAQCTLGRGAVLRGSQTKKKPIGGLCGTLPLPTTCCRTGFRWRIATFSAELWHFPKLTVTLDTGCGRCLSSTRVATGRAYFQEGLHAWASPLCDVRLCSGDWVGTGTGGGVVGSTRAGYLRRYTPARIAPRSRMLASPIGRQEPVLQPFLNY